MTLKKNALMKTTAPVVAALATSAILLALALSPAAGEPVDPLKEKLNLIPWPKVITLGPGAMPLTDKSRIVATSKALEPLAKILSDEIALATGLRLETAEGAGQAGDIVLKVNNRLQALADILTCQDRRVGYTREYAHAVTVSSQALVEGFDYRAVAEGTATLLQALKKDGDKVTLPRMNVKDWPQADFMAAMVDVGRQWIPIDALRQVVESCRLYKVRYLMLHLSDDQGWTFPSKSFPRLGSTNWGAHGGLAPRVYNLQELKDFVAFADARGVTIVPEFETPGHSGAIRTAMPEVFDAPKTPGGPGWIAVMNMAKDDMYGALGKIVDEMCEVFKSSPYFHIGCDECNFGILEGLPSTQEYLRAHNMKGIHELFVQHIERMNEFVRRNGKKTIVWEGAALDARTMKDEIIVMTWVGGSRSAEGCLAQGYTTITVPWGLGVPWPEWNMYICNGSRLKRTDRVIGAMLPMWEMSAEALVNNYIPGIPKRQERTWGPDNIFTEANFKKRCDATEALLAKLNLSVGFVAKGLDRPDDGVFYDTATVALTGPETPGAIHYTLDGSNPTPKSPTYAAPIVLKQTTTIKAAFFDPDSKTSSRVRAGTWKHVEYEQNPTTGKPVVVSGGTVEGSTPANAVDGAVELERAWVASPAPQWLAVDLKRAYKLNKVQVFPHWDGQRYCQYSVELSMDAKTWKEVVDMSHNTKPATAAGEVHEIAPTLARYVRINLLKDSSETAVRLVELRVYEAK